MFMGNLTETVVAEQDFKDISTNDCGSPMPLSDSDFIGFMEQVLARVVEYRNRQNNIVIYN